MPQNYDSTQVGVPYVRAHHIEIFYPEDSRRPQVIIRQKLAVKLADGTVRSLEQLPDIIKTFDMATDGSVPVPMVDPTSGAPLGPNTTLQQTMLSILGVVRKLQLEQG